MLCLKFDIILSGYVSDETSPIFSLQECQWKMRTSKQLVNEVFAISRIIQVKVRGYQLKPKAVADNPYRDLDYSGYHKNRI